MKKEFHSFCSAHQIPDKDCYLCKQGYWVDVDEEEDKNNN